MGLSVDGNSAGLSVIIRIEYIRIVNLTADFLFATSNVSIWSIVEPALGICCMAASTYRPLFKSLMDKASTHGYNSKPSGYHTGAGSSYIMSRHGYIKSKDTTISTTSSKDGNAPSSKSNSFDDVIAMERVESKAEGPSRKGSKKIWKARKKEVNGERSSEEANQGIMFSTTIEITRKPIGDDIV
jgi:hypothetical protein